MKPLWAQNRDEEGPPLVDYAIMAGIVLVVVVAGILVVGVKPDLDWPILKAAMQRVK